MRWLILFAAFVSGFCVMVLELLGGRVLAPWFGGSIHVWGSVITVFMLALSTGYLLGGRWSLWRPSLGRCSGLFIAAALSTALLAWVADPVMAAIFAEITDLRYGSLLAAFALFFLPASLLGMVSPYAVRLLTGSRESAGASAGLLYFVSTLGSTMGTLATAFYLILLFEVAQIVLGTAVLLAITALTLVLCLRRSRAS